LLAVLRLAINIPNLEVPARLSVVRTGVTLACRQATKMTSESQVGYIKIKVYGDKDLYQNR
jgi:hypothetical protein